MEPAAPSSTESEALTRLGTDRVRSLLIELSPEKSHSLTLYQRPDIVAVRDDLANFWRLRLRHRCLPGHRLRRIDN